MILSLDFFKVGWAPLTIQCLISHTLPPLPEILYIQDSLINPDVELRVCFADIVLNLNSCVPYSSLPKLIPISLASRIISDFGSTILSLPATSFNGTGTISLFLKAAIQPYLPSSTIRPAAAPSLLATTRS